MVTGWIVSSWEQEQWESKEWCSEKGILCDQMLCMDDPDGEANTVLLPKLWCWLFIASAPLVCPSDSHSQWGNHPAKKGIPVYL